MVNVDVLSWFIFQPSICSLSSESSVTLKSSLVTNPLTIIYISFTFKSSIDHLKNRSNPKVITRVYQFVYSTVKTAFKLELSVGCPLTQSINIKFMSFTQKDQSSKTTISIASMRFTVRAAGNATFIGLAAGYEVAHTLSEVWVWQKSKYIGYYKCSIAAT